jgi:hypothetical protein
MLALFQCCGNPFLGAAQQPSGAALGPGFRQHTPIVLRVRCPRCSRLAEARLGAPCTIAHILPSTSLGILRLRKPHGALLSPLQLTPDRRTESPAEDDQTLGRAWNLATALSAASTAPLPSRPGELSPELSAAAIGLYHPTLQAQARSAALHCSLADGPLRSPACSWVSVPMAWKLAPSPSEGPHTHLWHGLCRQT